MRNHLRKEAMNTTPATPSSPPAETTGLDEATNPRTAAINQAASPSNIMAIAMKNAKKRFFVPSSENSFGGIPYSNVMIDNGCSSLLLPFPGVDVLQAFAGGDYVWKIRSSGGTGAVNCVVLLIKHFENPSIGDIKLAGKHVCSLPFLRIHLNTTTAGQVIEMGKLTGGNLKKIQAFVAMNYPPKPRHHVLLGQMVLDDFISVQHRNSFVICSELPTRQAMMDVHQLLNDIEKPDGFDDLEDDDHDGDGDFEEFYDPWEEEELMDEVY